MKILNDLVNRKDVMAIINGLGELYEDSDENVYKALDSLYTMVGNLVPINIVEAGDLNIVCDDAESVAQYLQNHRD